VLGAAREHATAVPVEQDRAVPARVLYVARHAKSSWSHERLDDRSRPLSERGRRAAALVADAFSTRQIHPALVLASPARRVQETVEALAPVLGGATVVRTDERIYGADVGDLLDVLREVPAEVPSVLLVGHNPGVEDLVLDLAGNDASPLVARVEAKFPTGAVAVMRIEGPWLGLGAGGGVLDELILPRDLA
jgi:phosphohistidine phosphatase